MKIYRTKTNKYTCVADVGTDADGKRRKKRFTADSRADLRQMVTQYKAAKHIYFNSALFGDCLRRYIDARDGLVSPSTVRGYRTIERGLTDRYPALLARPVDALTDKDVQPVINALYREGRTPKTLRNWLSLINAVLIAERQTPVKPVMPAKVITDRPIPSIDEIQEMLRLMDGSRLEVPFRLALFGLRRGEICALTPDDLDERNVLHIHRSAVAQDGGSIIVKDTPKTDASNRYVQLPEALAEMLRERGFYYYSLNGLTVAYSKFCRRHGFPPYRFHDCRHFFASYCHRIGVPEADILAGGGWKTSNIMRQVYRHSMARNAATDAVSRLQNL